jgi:hypothetical protein
MIRTSLRRNPHRLAAASAVDLVMLQEIAAAIAVPERFASVAATYDSGETVAFPPLTLPLALRYGDVVPGVLEFQVSWVDALGVAQVRYVEPLYGDTGQTFVGWAVAA